MKKLIFTVFLVLMFVFNFISFHNWKCGVSRFPQDCNWWTVWFAFSIPIIFTLLLLCHKIFGLKGVERYRGEGGIWDAKPKKGGYKTKKIRRLHQLNKRLKWNLILAPVVLILFVAFTATVAFMIRDKKTPYRSILESDFFYASGLYEVISGLGVSSSDARTVSVGSGNPGDYKLFVIELDLPDYLSKKIYRIEVGGRFRGLEILSGYVDFRNGNMFDDQDVPDLKDALRRILFKLLRERRIPEEFLRS